MSEKIAERKLEIIIGLFLLGGIIAWLVIPTSFQDTTIILEGGGGGAPISCLPSGGFVLAQNLTDLCDVTIISPNTNQLIQYNGSQWVNVDSAFITTNATCTNLGSGTIICASDIDNILAFKTLVELNGIDITNSSSEIFIRNTGVLSANAGTGISVNQTTGNVLITNSAPDNTTCTNVGTGTVIYKDGECNFKTLVGSADISITNTTNTVVIDYNGTHVTQVTSNDNTTLGVVPTTGNVVLYPKYQLLCQNTLSSNASSLSCNNFTSMKYLKIETIVISQNNGTNMVMGYQFNGDTTTNYAWRRSANTGADTTGTNTNQCQPRGATSVASNGGGYIVMDIENLSSIRKMLIAYATYGIDLDDTNSPSHEDFACKWDNTVNQITSVTLMRVSGTNGYAVNTQLTVWGHN